MAGYLINKSALHAIQPFLGATGSKLQEKLPLDIELLRQLRCLNALNGEKKSTVLSVQSITDIFWPKVKVTEVEDDWKVFQVDSDFPVYNPRGRIEVFWNEVFQLQSSDGNLRYKLLPVVIKSALVLVQTNTTSE